MGTWSSWSLRDVLEDLVASENDNRAQAVQAGKPSVSSLVVGVFPAVQCVRSSSLPSSKHFCKNTAFFHDFPKLQGP